MMDSIPTRPTADPFASTYVGSYGMLTTLNGEPSTGAPGRTPLSKPYARRRAREGSPESEGGCPPDRSRSRVPAIPRVRSGGAMVGASGGWGRGSARAS